LIGARTLCLAFKSSHELGVILDTKYVNVGSKSRFVELRIFTKQDLPKP